MPASTGDQMLVRVACSRHASDCCCAGGGFPAKNQLGFLGAGDDQVDSCGDAGQHGCRLLSRPEGGPVVDVEGHESA